MTKKRNVTVRISASLLNSWKRCLDTGDLESFEETLKGEFEGNKYTEKGNEFEEKVLNGEDEVFSPIVENGIYQPHYERSLKINDNITAYIHGYLDVLKFGTIYDIKWTSRYEVGKFYHSLQHHVYFFLVPEAKNFKYLVQSNGNYFIEEYINNVNEAEILREEIANFLNWLGNYPMLRMIFLTKRCKIENTTTLESEKGKN